MQQQQQQNCGPISPTSTILVHCVVFTRMGVTYSTTSATETVIKRQSLRLTFFDATRVTETAQKHNFPPITDVNGLQSLFHSAFGYQRISSSEITDLLYMCEKMYKHDTEM